MEYNGTFSTTYFNAKTDLSYNAVTSCNKQDPIYIAGVYPGGDSSEA